MAATAPSRSGLLKALLFTAILMSAIVYAYTTIGAENSKGQVHPETYPVRPNDQIIAVAKTQLGAPYGHGVGAWTCSEYTQWVMNQATGTMISPTPEGQLYAGWQPRKTKRGDIILYNEGGDGISHAAIYMGHGKIIHASNYFMDVHVSYSRYLAYAYVTTRRVR